MIKQGTKDKVWERIFLLLGTNLEDREGNLITAIQKIADRKIEVVKKSGIYETAAWGKEDQPSFLNQVLEIATSLPPQQLIETVLHVEKEIGRVRFEKWGPRLIDIDILYYNKEIIVTKDLKVPHPELHNRKFTLAPLAEIAPDFKHPVLNVTNKTLLERCQDKLEVTKVG